MMYELVANSVTGALGKELNRIFPTVPWYRETSPAQLRDYPQFFVHQLTLDTQAERQNHWIVNYLVNIRYHAAADPATVVSGLQEELDDMAIKLMAELECIQWELPVRVLNPRTEKVDGVLHYFCNISVMCRKPLPEEIKQMELDVNTNIANLD